MRATPRVAIVNGEAQPCSLGFATNLGSSMASVNRDAQDLIDFVDTASVGLHWVASDGTILWANPADYEPLGYSETEYVGHNITEFHADDAVIGDILHRLTAGERLQNYEAHLRCKDGSTRKVLITSSVRYDTNGRFLHTRCFTVDVSCQRPEGLEIQLEALNREVERLRMIASRERGLVEAILTYSPHGIIVSDPSGKLVLQNEAAEKIWAGSATAENVSSWGKYRAFHADGRPFEGSDWSMARALSQRIVTEGEEIRVQRFDDTFGVLLGSSAPIFASDGELTGAVSVFADITRFKRHEEELRREMAATLLEEQRRSFIVEAGAVLASGLDYESTLTAVANLSVPAICDWCAVDISSDVGKLERLAIVHVDPAKVQWVRRLEAEYPPNPDSPHGVHEVVRAGKAQLFAEIPDSMLANLAVDGEHLRLMRELALRSAMIVPLRGRDGILGALTFVSAESGRVFDQKDLATAEQLANVAALAIQNARSYRDAVRANQAKDEFLATVSHELRTPLNAILGWARMVRSGSVQGEKLERALEIIERNSLTQVRLIEDLLDVSRVISGKMRLDVQSVDVVSVVDAALESVEHALQAKGIALVRIVDPQAGPIRGDAQRLQQVLWNLLSNAVKFTPKGGKIRLLVERVDSSIEITVHDTGQGIPAHLLSTIFGRFEQADGSKVRVHGGLGLGLAIARHIVELHGGTIEAHSEGEGRGATFVVSLPVSPLRPLTGSPFRHPTALAPTPSLEHPRELQGLSVLIIDDEADTREMLAELLTQRGCSVIIAASAADGIAVLDRASPQVIVCDIGMPVVDGYRFIEQVRQRGANKGGRTIAVALTAYAAPEDRRRALSAGFQMHLTKPVEPAEFLAVIANLAQLALADSGEA